MIDFSMTGIENFQRILKEWEDETATTYAKCREESQTLLNELERLIYQTEENISKAYEDEERIKNAISHWQSEINEAKTKIAQLEEKNQSQQNSGGAVSPSEESETSTRSNTESTAPYQAQILRAEKNIEQLEGYRRCVEENIAHLKDYLSALKTARYHLCSARDELKTVFDQYCSAFDNMIDKIQYLLDNTLQIFIREMQDADVVVEPHDRILLNNNGEELMQDGRVIQSGLRDLEHYIAELWDAQTEYSRMIQDDISKRAVVELRRGKKALEDAEKILSRMGYSLEQAGLTLYNDYCGIKP